MSSTFCVWRPAAKLVLGVSASVSSGLSKYLFPNRVSRRDSGEQPSLHLALTYMFCESSSVSLQIGTQQP